MKRLLFSPPSPRGFTLVVTLSLMVLLMVLATGLLSLSTLSLRNSSQGSAQAVAQANARLALLLAIGELQEEMGPDMRVSAESALFDKNEDTESIDGVDQSHWLASYHSWGNWLNAEYELPGDGSTLRIHDTYTPRRAAMFRRWLLSLPEGMRSDVDAPRSVSNWDDGNSVILVGQGSLGDAAQRDPDQVTRAYLVPVGNTGKQAWWIGPENHKAKITLAKQPRSLDADEWETSQGNTAEVGVGALDGFEALDDDEEISDRLVSRLTLGAAQVEIDDVEDHFFDLTAASRGVVASVRGGHLKKDLSLLFEKDGTKLPSPYRFNQSRAIQEPSIRPMSPELLAKDPTIPNRHFASWTNMRHFYRMYREDSDATIGGTGGTGSLNWARGKPWTQFVSTADVGRDDGWDGANNYWRIPILAKITFIYSLVSEPSSSQRGKYDCYHVYSPVFTYWNPYNTELRVPDDKITMLTSAYKVLPNAGRLWLGNTIKKETNALGLSINTRSHLRSGNGNDIIFKPGEFKVFSHDTTVTSSVHSDMVPGFDPQAIGGEKLKYGTFSPGDRPGLSIEFSHSYWGGNINRGNTGGSLCHQDWWDRDNHPGGMPMTYANDWFQKAQTHTLMTPPGVSNIARWVFSDSDPVPVAFCQLVIKGLSEFNYESIRWDRDWRSRNWIHAPPFYFGSGMYISEDNTIAHTQRLDCPYVMFFGPTSMAEMPKVVGHVGSSAFLGSGSNPYEKITSVPALELPTAPVGSLAGFSGMRINPGWTRADMLGPHLSVRTYSGNGVQSTGEESLHAAETKRVAYQSGVTGPGIGNSFIHPMLARNDVYRYIDNSKSEDVPDRGGDNWQNTITNDTMAYNDYWDHVFLLNDALWDDYFVSSLANQSRPGASSAHSLTENFDRLLAGEELSNSRYVRHTTDRSGSDALDELKAADGYLKAAKHLMVDGMFNVNSTSVPAWHALFAGIRERQLVFRGSSGQLGAITPPGDKRVAISRLNTEIAAEEMDDPESGTSLGNGTQAWSGLRFLDDNQLLKLAQECVRQVKLRGPFLNFSEFINRRLSDDELGTMGALQSAIDYDDSQPDSGSINFRFKSGPDFMITQDDLGSHSFATPEAIEGSRFAGIPGYVIQSDLLKPIANTLSVRDDTFRIRAYGEANDNAGRVTARAWCEAIVQRVPEYYDPTNDADVPARLMDSIGRFTDNDELTDNNRRFGRRFRIESFRWLSSSEV